MKILFFIYSLSAGGAERVTVNLSNYWVKKGWEVTIFTLSPRNKDFYTIDNKINRIDSSLSTESKGLFAGLLNNARRIYRLREVLRQEAPDIAVSMMSSANILLSLSSIGIRNLKVIGSEHTHPPKIPLGTIWEFLRSKLYGRLVAITALTEASSDWIKSNTNAKFVAVIPNAATWPLVPHNPYLDPVKISKGKRIALAVGRLSEEKGFDMLLLAYAKIAKDFSDWVLVIIGEGTDRIKLEGMVQSHNLGGQAILPGIAGNMSDWYEASSLYIMSSRFEGFGNTLAEALVHGLPVVSFDCETGPRTIVRHGVDGILVPSNDVVALSNSMKLLMTDESLRDMYASRAVEARSKFSVESIAGAWENLFNYEVPTSGG